MAIKDLKPDVGCRDNGVGSPSNVPGSRPGESMKT